MRDVWLHRSRSVLVILAIAVALAGAGSILDTWALVQRATREGYQASNPASATLYTDSIDTALLAAVRAHPAIADAQGRRTLMGAMQVQGAYRTAMLFAMDDFTTVQIGRLRPESGAWPPAEGALVVERSSMQFSGAEVGGAATLALGDTTVALPVTGIVRDVGLAPGWMEHVVYGFVSSATLARLGAPSTLTELQIVVRTPAATRDEVRRIAYDIKSLVERTGRRVTDVDVPVPGEHIHAGQMDSLLYTQGAFGLLALVVSAFLIVNLISAMLAGQIREIGVMKTLGASATQLSAMYLVLAIVLGVLASLIAIPVAAWIGREYAALKGELLNFPVSGFAIPWWAIAVQALVGVLLPVAAAAIPVRRGCRIPVSSALRDFGITENQATTGTRFIGNTRWVSRPVILSVRNAFRKRQRMILTLLALAAGGSVYLGSRNLRASVIGSLDLLYDTQKYDFSVRLAEPAPADSVEAVIGRVAGVQQVQGWGSARAAILHGDEISGNDFTIQAPPATAPMLEPRLESGRWPTASDGNVLVVSRRLLGDEPTVQLGATALVSIDGRPTGWKVIGVVESGPMHVAYASREALAALRGHTRISAAVVDGDEAGLASEVDLIRRVREALDRAGLTVASSQRVEEARRVMEDHLLMVVQFLAVMGWVMILVGGMGLASTMGLAVLERRREIGVMRAIGAGHGSIMNLIQIEGLVIAILSWLIALPLSVPMSAILGDAFGRVMLRVPLTLVPEASGVWRWLAVVVVVSLVACLWPAIRAMRVTVASALAYE
jgi:putative ABC transport system permease protein